ncbi:hypothetical protein AXF42_Ash016291 [Apostasia shenzhenica]|uniref:Uncharacterized protein n=1 Tax=Apostasia shenzhenica TaxID=1088818 RepID=A0A2H9ZXA8_9ASPA|nr:hypothetical protein AXF42_Ash016291 [Apostasia shenzhenica]
MSARHRAPCMSRPTADTSSVPRQPGALHLICRPPYSARIRLSLAATSPTSRMPPFPDLSHSSSLPGAALARDLHAGSMITADELFLNGQIRPMKLSPT